MEHKIAVATRVLHAVQLGNSVVQADIASLRKWVDAEYRGVPYDELACLVIMAETERKKKASQLNAKDSARNAARTRRRTNIRSE